MNRLFLLAMLPGLVPVGALPVMARSEVRPVTADVARVDVRLPAGEPSHLARPIVIDQSEDGLFYIQASVNGTPVRFVVDSGSSVTILNAADAARASVGSMERVSVETAGGTAPMQRARIAQVEFAGRTLTGIDAAIVKNDLPVSLLGQSALSRFGSVTFRGSRLELE